MPRITKALFAAAAMIALATPAGAQDAGDAVAAFYRGKTLTIIVGSSPGGGYDPRLSRSCRLMSGRSRFL